LASHGDAESQYQLGRTFTLGVGVTQDFVIAHMWFNLAAARGHEGARVERDKLGERMTPQQLEEAQRLAREWRPR